MEFYHIKCSLWTNIRKWWWFAMSYKISVIIPVYNSENTIVRTLKSIKEQSYKNYEVLIINDGSTDNSLEKINEFCGSDNRFLIFNTSNQGVSNARNVGLDNATGDYIIFIDSDDYINRFYFENIIIDISDYDLLIYSFQTKNNKSIKEISYVRDIDDSICKIDFCRFLTNSRLFANVTNKVFKKNRVDNIRFDTSTNLGEDYEFVMHYFIKISKYKYVKKSFYIYDLTTGSLGFCNKKNTYELKSKGNFRKLELYNMYNYPLDEVYDEFVKAFVIDMMYLIIYQRSSKKEMIKNQEHCMKVFDLTKIKLSFKNKFLVSVFNCKIYFIVKLFSLLLCVANNLIKKVKYGY